MDQQVFQKAKGIEKRVENLERFKKVVSAFFVEVNPENKQSSEQLFCDQIKKLVLFQTTKPDYLKITETIDQQIEQLKQEFNEL